jgi:phosphocarrier protein HPr
MVNQQLKVTNSQGFHMRPATMFVSEMAKFQSSVTIKFNGLNVNGKSLMNLIAACIKFGSEIEIVCEGDDEQAALEKAVQLIESGLGEE